MKFKIMKVKREELQKGDLVLSDDESHIYFICEEDITLLHKHPYFYVIYISGNNEKLYLHELSKIKTICRLVKE